MSGLAFGGRYPQSSAKRIGRGDYYVLGILNVLNFFEIFEIKVLNMLPH